VCTENLSVSIFFRSFCLHLFDALVPHFLGIIHIFISLDRLIRGVVICNPRTRNPPSRCSRTLSLSSKGDSKIQSEEP